MIKHIQAFYLCLAVFYGLIFVLFVALSLQRADWMNALYNLFWGSLSVAFGLGVRKLIGIVWGKRKHE